MILVVNGVKRYPVAKFVNIQHIIYNYNDKCYNEMIEKEYSGNTVDKFNESQELCSIVDNPYKDGIVYAAYPEYKKLKDIIGMYVYRHGGY